MVGGQREIIELNEQTSTGFDWFFNRLLAKVAHYLAVIKQRTQLQYRCFIDLWRISIPTKDHVHQSRVPCVIYLNVANR